MEDKSLKKIIARAEYDKGKSYLQSLEAKQKRPKNYLSIAASIVVLLGISLTAIYYNKSSDSDALFAEYFEPYTNIVAPISRGNLPKTMEERAFYYYESKAYEKALKVFDSLLVVQPADATILNFYKANILLQQGKDLNKAIKLLEANSNITNTWQEKNLWYLCLAYIKSNDKGMANKYLKQLDDMNSTFNKSKRLKLSETLIE